MGPISKTTLPGGTGEGAERMGGLLWGTGSGEGGHKLSHNFLDLPFLNIIQTHISILADLYEMPSNSCYVYKHHTTHRTYRFTFHPKDKAIMVQCLA